MKRCAVLKLVLLFWGIITFGQTPISLTNTVIADSLDAKGKYKESIKFRTFALEELGHSSNYKLLINAKWNYTQACILETTGGIDNHKKALVYSLKAKEIASNIATSTIFFKHEIANRIYHQYGYSGDWKNALIEAKENYKILRDTFPDYNAKVLWVIDDLGFITKTLHDYETSLAYYAKSLPLYEQYYPEKAVDVTVNYNMIATNYRKLGLRKNEYDILKKAEAIWDTKIIDKAFVSKFTCYEQLVTWNIYYGNYNEALRYLKKQEDLLPKVIANFKETERSYLSRQFYLRVYYNYIELFFETEEYEKVKNYLVLYNNNLPEDKFKHSFEASFKSLYYVYQSRLPETTQEKEIEFLKKAIEVATTYGETFTIKPVYYQIKLFKKYVAYNCHNDASELIDDMLNENNTLDPNLKFYLLANRSTILAHFNQTEKASIGFQESFNFLVKESENSISLDKISIDSIHPYYSYETIDGILLASQFYAERFAQYKNLNDLKIAENFVIIASKIFNNLYLGGRYNENLYKAYKSIEEHALAVLCFNNKNIYIDTIIEALENNATKFTWSKFLYNKNKSSVNVPDSIVNKESTLKSLLNYYQQELYKIEKERLPLDTLNFRIAETNAALNVLQQEVKENYLSYYNSNYATFKLAGFQNKLSEDQQIVKYIISQGKLYCFIISNSDIKFKAIKLSVDWQTSLEQYLTSLKTFNSNIVAGASTLSSIVPKEVMQSSKLRITIIPDGILCYVPFETLFPTLETFQDSKKVFSYATSLALLNHQVVSTPSEKKLQLGFFSAQYQNEKILPSIADEENSITKRFQGKSFYNLSTADFKKNAKDYDILHLAVHTTINREDPDISNLSFGQEELLISELYNESFKAQLAVLSACETGDGYFINGEGIQSVSRAFTYTGIPSTVMSLWKVDDASTAFIMGQFYENLGKGVAKDVALRNAKTTYLKTVEEDALKHPYYWAGFIISGNTTALVESRTSIYLYIGLFILLVVLIFTFRKRFN